MIVDTVLYSCDATYKSGNSFIPAQLSLHPLYITLTVDDGVNRQVVYYPFRVFTCVFNPIDHSCILKKGQERCEVHLSVNDCNNLIKLYSRSQNDIVEEKRHLTELLTNNSEDLPLTDEFVGELLEVMEEYLYCSHPNHGFDLIKHFNAFLLRFDIGYRRGLKPIVEAFIQYISVNTQVFTTEVISKFKSMLENAMGTTSTRISQLVVLEPYYFARGGQGYLYRGRLINNNQLVAVKKIPLRGMNGRSIPENVYKHFQREASIMHRINERDIVKYIHYSVEEDCIFLIEEYFAGGSLLDYILKSGRVFSENEARPIVLWLLRVVKKLHERNIIHRDIKLENIMLRHPNDLNDLVLIDLGFAREIDAVNYIHTRGVGTTEYESPEIATRRVHYGYGVDVWSITCCIYALVTGVFPFGKNTHVEAKITAGKYNKGGSFQYLSPSLRALIDAGFTVEEERRISIDEMLNSPWITGLIPQQVPNENYIEVNNTSSVGYVNSERYINHYDGNGVEYFCLSWVNVYLQIGDMRPLFFLNRNTVVNVDMTMNVNGNWWIHIRGDGLHDHMREKIEAKWILAQEFKSEPKVIPKSCSYFKNTESQHCEVRMSINGDCVESHYINNVVIVKNVFQGDTLYGFLHDQTLCCYGIPRDYRWIVLRNAAGFLFDVKYHQYFCLL